MLDLSRLLAGADKRGTELRGLSDTFRLDQKKFSFAESQEGFRALRVGATAEHVFTALSPHPEDATELFESTAYRSRRVSFADASTGPNSMWQA
jgi:hypothetical protein